MPADADSSVHLGRGFVAIALDAAAENGTVYDWQSWAPMDSFVGETLTKHAASLMHATQIVEYKMAFREHTLERLAGILDDIVDAIWQRELKAMSPQAGAMLEAVQQKENVFWLTMLYACFTITMCANWLSWFA